MAWEEIHTRPAKKVTSKPLQLSQEIHAAFLATA
jgi:hypothetical protein